MGLVHKDLSRAYYVPGAARTWGFCSEPTGQMWSTLGGCCALGERHWTHSHKRSSWEREMAPHGVRSDLGAES